MSDVLTNVTLPKTSATITLRIIKSFEYRTEKSLVLRGINLEQTTVRGLKEQVLQLIQTLPGWKPFRNVPFDTLKVYTRAHGAKTSNLIINLDHEELMLDDDDAFLADIGIENETELSFFKIEAYEIFKCNPETKWT
ncbi:hypothetical protein JB92DRAFT_3091496 [Gautieria morchelliformis]|nr:hypothetical protein JB92DRAFT_3091496 [Gautieria morchelliformis]